MTTKLSIDLDEKINLIYNFSYELSDKSCYQVTNVDIHNINMDDIKIPHTNEYNKELFNEINKGSFQLINFNEKTNLTILKRISNNFSTNIYITPYDKKSSISKMNNSNNKDSLFSYVLSKLVLDEKTSHILLPIINIDVQFDDIRGLLKSYSSFDYYNNLLEDDKITDVFSLRIKENFFSSTTLKEYIDTNHSNKNIDYKIILFQLIHTLYVIQTDYPDFIHNNLSLDNILVQENNLSANNKYKHNEKIFKIKNNKIFIKISSFTKSESNIILKTTDKYVGNKYTDLHYFLNKLYKFNKFSGIDSETQDFMNRIFPKKYIGSSNPDEFIKPSNILNDSYFKSLQIINNINEKKSSHGIYMKPNSKENNKNIFMTNLLSDSKSILGNQSDTYTRVDVSNKKLSRKIHKNTGDVNSNIKRNDINHMNKEVLTRTLNQTGGSSRQEGNAYKKERNNPYLTNDAIDTYAKTKQEQPPVSREPPLLAEQKIYDLTSKSKPQPYIPTDIPSHNPFNAHGHPLHPWETQPNQVHVVKPVTMSFSNPVSGNHMTINRVYEDMIPGDRFVFSLKSVFERKQLTNFFRSMILENGDGEELSVSTGSKRTLLSYIKLLEVNPYSIERNPYKSLSKGFLLYSSAYPIRHDNDRNNLSIAKQSIGVNVRIYELSDGAKRCYKLNNKINCNDFEVWRDIKYYEYVRENIIKRKVSPNFVSLYLYTIDSNSRIDYNKLDMVRNKHLPTNMDRLESKNNNLVNNLHEFDPFQLLMLNSSGVQYNTNNKIEYIPTEAKLKEVGKYLGKNNYMIGSGQDWSWTETGLQFLLNKRFVFTNRLHPTKGSAVKVEEIKALATLIGKHDLTIGTGQSLIALTEAPNSNILQWASPLVDNFGTVQRMTETGYHTPDVWKSILFQLVYSCAVLEEKGIIFHKFSLENNFFIKDLFTNSEKRDHWIYQVGQMNFYVPNYGYLLMVDSKYVDIEETTSETLLEIPSNRRYKINSTNLYADKNNITDISGSINVSFKSIINPDNFTTNLGKMGGEHPDQEILDLLKMIHDDNSCKSIKECLVKFFPFFLNNRIGTSLSNDEKMIISVVPTYNFKSGELVVYQPRYGEYCWALFVKGNDDGTKKIIQGLKKNETDVYPNTLFKFPENETVKQKMVNFINYDSNYTIETYNLDN
jgi:hypothetical protein